MSRLEIQRFTVPRGGINKIKKKVNAECFKSCLLHLPGPAQDGHRDYCRDTDPGVWPCSILARAHQDLIEPQQQIGNIIRNSRPGVQLDEAVCSCHAGERLGIERLCFNSSWVANSRDVWDRLTLAPLALKREPSMEVLGQGPRAGVQSWQRDQVLCTESKQFALNRSGERKDYDLCFLTGGSRGTDADGRARWSKECRRLSPSPSRS